MHFQCSPDLKACPAALRLEDAFIEFIQSGEQRMVIDESLSGFGVRLINFKYESGYLWP